VAISDDPLPVFAKADGVLDFTAPAATVEFAGYAAQARIAHIIGTTGCTPEDDAKIAAAARHATIVKSGNMSLGVNLLAALVEQAAKALGPEDFDIEVLEMHHRHKVDAPSGTACCSARRRRGAATSASGKTASASATASPARAWRARSASPRCAAVRSSASIP
jgi:4-hydroxy-tetrahydrodipicolinate reductase